MTTILCPTRGGESSIANQMYAIELAKEQGASLIFLYVTDVHFLDRVASPLLIDIEEELDELGEFMLAMAQERAEAAGVRARTVVRRGAFRDAVESVVREHAVSTMVLGSATEGTGVTTHDLLEGLSQAIIAATGIEVILLHNGEVRARFGARE